MDFEAATAVIWLGEGPSGELPLSVEETGEVRSMASSRAPPGPGRDPAAMEGWDFDWTTGTLTGSRFLSGPSSLARAVARSSGSESALEEGRGCAHAFPLPLPLSLYA